MLRAIQELRTGTLSPSRLKSAVRTDLSLELREERVCYGTFIDRVLQPRSGVSMRYPRRMVLPSVRLRAVLDIDVDPAEGRYMICSTSSGGLNIFDLWKDNAWSATERGGAAEAIPCVAAHTVRDDVVSALQWYPAGSSLFVTGSYGGNVSVWDAETQQLDAFQTFGKSNGLATPIHELCMPRCARDRASVVALANGTRDLALVDLVSGSAVSSFPVSSTNPEAVVWSVAFSPTHEYMLAVGCGDGVVRLYDIRRAGTHSLLLTFGSHTGQATTDTSRLNPRVSSSVMCQSRMRVLSSQMLQPLAHANSRGRGAKRKHHSTTGYGSDHDRRNTEQIKSVLSPDGAERSASSRSHEGWVHHVCFSGSGEKLYSHGSDRRLASWDVLSGSVLVPRFSEIRSSDAIPFSCAPWSQTLYVAERGIMLACDAETGRMLSMMSDRVEHVTRITCDPFLEKVYVAYDNGIIRPFSTMRIHSRENALESHDQDGYGSDRSGSTHHRSSVDDGDDDEQDGDDEDVDEEEDDQMDMWWDAYTGRTRSANV
ncbi:DNA excision repair protein ERCC-8 [Porphyridium purpureum]|uniref:DNA excision repair protein ERCC-8 n=1 Tax=Porphyridium purpureum TaxID=35688 RepID=A0A5J4YQI5_PORPP|nr:DNA excision repair protein ERCC-8 [Porphyridium purpureum]|eukprot:POR1647..scf236_6